MREESIEANGGENSKFIALPLILNLCPSRLHPNASTLLTFPLCLSRSLLSTPPSAPPFSHSLPPALPIPPPAPGPFSPP
eukprot:1846379-Pleurochrysis_carterae.AAC.2